MQTAGHVIVNGRQILVLARYHKNYVALKLRMSGKPGHHFSDEELHLADEPGKLAHLLSGQVIKC